MLFFYYLITSFFLFSSIYIYNNGISSLFKKIFHYIDYTFDHDIEEQIENLPTKLIIISSHTSIYDFIIGMLFYYAYLREKYNVNILMKKDFEIITKPILSLIDNKIDLISVSSDKKHGLTDKICNDLIDKNNYMLYISPEGTRKCTETLRSGYWIIAKKLNIDILYVGIDFSDKIVKLEKVRKAEEDWEEEQKLFINDCKKYIPLYPERCHWTKEYYS
jgi:1-acyl-sn-glycerol-3-phosphate acyltransferase